MNQRLLSAMVATTCLSIFATAVTRAQQPQVATAVAFTEGPAVYRDGNVYFTDLVWQRIMKLSASGELSVFRERSNNANGLLFDAQGRLVACEGAESQRLGVRQTFTPRVTRTEMRTGAVEVLTDNYRGAPFVGPNDVTLDSRGRLYFTDLAGGAVYRIDAPQQVARILARPDIERPNGIQRIHAAAFDVMKAARYCTLVTIGGDRHPQARIVDPLLGADRTIWIATNPVTRKVEEIRRDPRVTLLFFNAAVNEYVTVHARARVVADGATKAARWKPEWQPFYKERHDGADFLLIEVRPFRYEISSPRHGLPNDANTWRPVVLDIP